MGACSSHEVAEGDARAKAEDRLARDALNSQEKEDNAKVKLLILGPGESGKSTLFKQMKLIYGAPFTTDEVTYVRSLIHNNMILTMKELMYAVDSLLNKKVECTAAWDTIQDCVAMKKLWEDPAIQEAWGQRTLLQVVESVVHFFQKIDEVTREDYMPSTVDILTARVRTSGIVTEKYMIQGTPYEMYDVGGQRNERRKWARCFDNVTAILFIVAISEYDQKMFEDNSTNRMVDAFEIFEEVCTNTCFDNSTVILFLNKKDLYEEKIRSIKIEDQESFADYAGKPNDAQDGIDFFLNKFTALNPNAERQIYHHVTVATDTNNMRAVINTCRVTLLRKSVTTSGFM